MPEQNFDALTVRTQTDMLDKLKYLRQDPIMEDPRAKGELEFMIEVTELLIKHGTSGAFRTAVFGMLTVINVNASLAKALFRAFNQTIAKQLMKAALFSED